MDNQLKSDLAQLRSDAAILDLITGVAGDAAERIATIAMSESIVQIDIYDQINTVVEVMQSGKFDLEGCLNELKNAKNKLRQSNIRMLTSIGDVIETPED